MERFWRWLRSYTFWSKQLARSHDLISLLHQAELTYNNRIHSTTKLRPAETTEKDAVEILLRRKQMRYKQLEQGLPPQKYTVGQIVRLQKLFASTAFEKTGDIKLENQLYEIAEIIPTEPEPSYTLRTTDFSRKLLRGTFVQSLIIPVNAEDALIDKGKVDNFTRNQEKLKKDEVSHRPITRSYAK